MQTSFCILAPLTWQLCLFWAIYWPPYSKNDHPKKLANYGQRKMANNERRKGHVHFIMCSSPTNLTIVLLLCYIVTSLLKKYVILKNGHFMPIMAIYEITHAQTNLILVSTPTNKVIAVLLTPNPTL